ncbi:hypothetical protein J6590_096669, partial [Homalodisca vitripennis]
MGQITSGNLEWRWNGPAGCLSQKTGNDDAHAISRNDPFLVFLNLPILMGHWP